MRTMTPYVLSIPISLLLLGCQKPEPVDYTIPLMLPFTSEEVFEDGIPAITWAVENINAAGGIAGSPLSVEYYDLDAETDPQALAEELIADGARGILGPGSSAQVMAVADTLIEREVPMISFTSSAGEVLRAYGGSPYIWRTRESDIAQVELALQFAVEEGATSIALVTDVVGSGETFFNWFGFYATEAGFSEENVHIMVPESEEGSGPSPQPCLDAMQAALDTSPDLIFAVPNRPKDYDCFIEAYREAGTRVVVLDTGLDTSTISKIPGATGLEGFRAAPDPDNGYAEAHVERWEKAPEIDSAQAYDAVLLFAYAMAYTHEDPEADLGLAISTIVEGSGDVTSWDQDGIQAALTALEAGELPDLNGATGLLDFDPALQVDLTSSSYEYWVIDGPMKVQRTYTTDAGELLTGADVAGLKEAEDSLWSPEEDKTDLWAIIASFSSSWGNYRHQADALRQYQLLRASGVPDDHIIFIAEDDIATNASNGIPGDVYNESGGENLYYDVAIDYDTTISADDFIAILSGEASADLPEVLGLTEGSNLYVYLAGHGGTSGMPVGAETVAEGLEGENTLSPAMLTEALCALTEESRLRQALMIIESCYSGAFGSVTYGGIETGCETGPLEGVALITAANTSETSLAADYFSDVGAWVADDMSQALIGTLEDDPNQSIFDLYQTGYYSVSGSHVSLYNSGNFGSVTTTSVREFISP